MMQQNAVMMQTMMTMIQSIEKNQKPRVLPPGKFKLDNGETLYQYLIRFEEYYDVVSPGSKEGRIPLLGSNLEGEVFDVYKVAVKNTTDYEELKEKLLQWNRNEINKDNKLEADNFTDAELKSGEQIPVFALRLIGLAERAFPGSEVRQMQIVRRKLLTSLPQEVRKPVETTLTTLETALGIQIPWDRLVATVEANLNANKIANNLLLPTGNPVLPTTIKSSPEVIDLTKVNIAEPMNFPANHCTGSCGGCHCRIMHADTQVTTQSVPPRSIPQSPNRNTPPFAGRNNNFQNNEREVPRSSRPFEQTRESNGKKITCNHCHKDGHYMSACRRRPLCQYCGKRGHVFEECYLAQKKCLHCQQVGHLVTDCPNRSNFEERVSCPYCKGEHLGKDCSQRPN
jgi:hypothetical protein